MSNDDEIELLDFPKRANPIAVQAIDLSMATDREKWTQLLNVTEERLRYIVSRVGPMPAAVTCYLRSGSVNLREPSPEVRAKIEARKLWRSTRPKPFSTVSRSGKGEISMAVAKKASVKKVAKTVGRKTAVKAASRKSSAKTAVARKAPAKKAARKAAIKRTLLEPTPGDKRYVRRDPEGRFKDVADVGESLSADERSTAKTRVKPGQGDKGDVAKPPYIGETEK